jgi:hypothetical protein
VSLTLPWDLTIIGRRRAGHFTPVAKARELTVTVTWSCKWFC